MDYQPVVLGSLSDAEALLSRIAEAIAVVRRHRGQVVAPETADGRVDRAAAPR
jgi:hypothetical protein